MHCSITNLLFLFMVFFSFFLSIINLPLNQFTLTQQINSKQFIFDLHLYLYTISVLSNAITFRFYSYIVSVLLYRQSISNGLNTMYGKVYMGIIQFKIFNISIHSLHFTYIKLTIFLYLYV